MDQVKQAESANEPASRAEGPLAAIVKLACEAAWIAGTKLGFSATAPGGYVRRSAWGMREAASIKLIEAEIQALARMSEAEVNAARDRLLAALKQPVGTNQPDAVAPIPLRDPAPLLRLAALVLEDSSKLPAFVDAHRPAIKQAVVNGGVA